MSVAQTSYRYWRSRGYSAQSAVAKARTDTQSRFTSKPGRFGGFGTDPKASIYCVESSPNCAMRKDWADKIANLQHKGHYADAFQGETYRGIVIQISAHNGEARYLAGYVESQGDFVLIERDTVWTDQLGAAHRADQLAERNAEESREHDSAWQAGSQYASNLSDIKTSRREALAILQSRKAIADPVARQALADRVQSLIDDIAKLRAENVELKDGNAEGFWFYPSVKLLESFNEGANS